MLEERRDIRFSQAKREAVKSFGSIPLMLLMFIASIAAGAFSSLWLGYELNQSLLTGIHLPPFLSLGRDFVIGFFSSCIAIGTYILFILATIFYTRASKYDDEDEEKDRQARSRKRKNLQ